MINLKHFTLGLSTVLLTTICSAQELALGSSFHFKNLKACNLIPNETLLKGIKQMGKTLDFSIINRKKLFIGDFVLETNRNVYSIRSNRFNSFNEMAQTSKFTLLATKQQFKDNPINPMSRANLMMNVPQFDLGLTSQEKEPFLKNRRNVYSSLWAFASLNYLYADLVGVMDKNKLVQYQTGVVEGVKITPQFLTIAAGFMQIPLANVFLPQVIKNENTLRWVQIASGTVMTLVQSGTLFVGKPTPYYALFSAFEIAATTYITIDAIKWKTKSNRRPVIIN